MLGLKGFGRVDQGKLVLKLGALVTRRVSEGVIKFLANASGYHFKFV